MEEEKWEDMDDVSESRSTNKDALTIAGAILLGCLIISGTLAYVSARGVKIIGQVGSAATADQAAKQPDVFAQRQILVFGKSLRHHGIPFC